MHDVERMLERAAQMRSGRWIWVCHAPPEGASDELGIVAIVIIVLVAQRMNASDTNAPPREDDG